MKKLTKNIIVTLGITLAVVIFASSNIVYGKTNRVKIDSFKDKYIKASLEKRDKDNDGYLNKKELKKVTSLDLESESAPINLKGIGKLKYLKSLTINNCCPKRVKNIKAIYNLSNLEELNLSSCRLKKGTELNLCDLENLKSLTLYVTGLKYLDLTDNKKLEKLSFGSKIDSLDLRKNKNLKELFISGNDNLKTINLKKNKKLEKLTLMKIDSKYSLKHNKELKVLNIDNAKMPDISKNTKLEELDLFYPTNEQITIGEGNKNLKEIDICLGYNPLDVTVDGCKNLEKLHLWGSGVFKNVKITNCGKIKDITLSQCTIENLECDIVQDVELYWVNITYEEIEESKINIKKMK